MAPTTAPVHKFEELDDDDEGWEDMPVIRDEEFAGAAGGLDQEDQKKYHYQASAKGGSAANARGDLIDVDDWGTEWRSKVVDNESEYTRLRVQEEDDADEVHLRTRYLFDEDKAMTPLSQMQATKGLLTEAQRVAYVGLCSLTSREMAEQLKQVKRKELKASAQNMELWSMKIMGRLYYHMELETQEQKMIESLAEHGLQPEDLVPQLMTTHTVANPEYDPAEARRVAAAVDEDEEPVKEDIPIPPTPTTAKVFQTTTKVFEEGSTAAIAGVTTSLSSADKNVTLDIRWTILCDLFLILIADSVYDARSRVLLERVALKLGLGWLDVVKFESRVTEALEIQEGVEKMEQQTVIDGVQKSARNKRYMMMGLATLGGGLVIGLSAGLLAPVIGAGLGAAFTTIGITGTSTFLAGAGGAAVITTGGVLTGSSIAGRGMAHRTQQVRTFDILPLHNNKRVSCILTVPGFMTGMHDDPRLPFSVLDPIVGDVFSVLWEPDMIRETGSALKILTTEVLTQIGQTVLQATVMATLMTALQWPLILTKLGYLIDNPWHNALDRAKAAGRVLADVLIQRHLGVRPITLIGFSLGARVIFYALIELAKQKAFGVVQDVFLLGATLTASTGTWCETRSVVSGRYVNAYARNDWVLNYLFRATSGGLSTVAGLRPIPDVPGLENVDVTDKISGHMSYRTFMPLILDQLGFPVSADYFDEPEEPDFEGERVVVKPEDGPKKKKSWFGRSRRKPDAPARVSRPPTAQSYAKKGDAKAKEAEVKTSGEYDDDDLPPREGDGEAPPPYKTNDSKEPGPSSSTPDIPLHAGFDFAAIKEALGKVDATEAEVQAPQPTRFAAPNIPAPSMRSESTPYPVQESDTSSQKASRSSLDEEPVAGPSSRPDMGQRSVSESPAARMSENPFASSRDMEGEKDSYRPGFGRQETPPTLSFGGSDGLLWTAPPDNGRTPTQERGYGFGGPSVPYVPPPEVNPFMAFGGVDGSINEPPKKDPSAAMSWDAHPSRTSPKPAPTFNANPWS